MSRGLTLLLTVLSAAMFGCGSSSSAGSTSSTGSTATSTVQTGTPASAPGLTAAEHPAQSSFPAAGGRSLQALAAVARAQATLGLATGTFTPGRNRIAFALTTPAGAYLYGPTAIYLAPTPSAPASGPFLAPADPVTVAPGFRSRQNTGPGGIQAVYETAVPLARARTYAVLVLTATGGRIVGATGEIAVATSSPIPAIGQPAPRVATDTPASVGANTALLTTRVPPEPAAMHAASLADVLGRRPVALLFSTPQLCQSRVCGPVTDVAVSLFPRFGTRMQFIHEEVYADNQPGRGLRSQMKAFHLQTEPWLFVMDRSGRIVARLEGTFGVNSVADALQAGLK